MSAEAVCAAYVMAEKPEDGIELLVLCELEPLHEPPHHGHMHYENENESRCIDWTGGEWFIKIYGTPEPGVENA